MLSGRSTLYMCPDSGHMSHVLVEAIALSLLNSWNSLFTDLPASIHLPCCLLSTHQPARSSKTSSCVLGHHRLLKHTFLLLPRDVYLYFIILVPTKPSIASCPISTITRFNLEKNANFFLMIPLSVFRTALCSDRSGRNHFKSLSLHIANGC